MNEVMVSICCLAYNHEKYIKSAIEGFLSQKCDFKFEIIIHDDASTDDTSKIIKEYQEQYPDLIKPIFQAENIISHGKGKMIYTDFILPLASGKYIASCEGDDYWIDPLKLQKQITYMEEHPQCTFCFTNAYIEDQRNPLQPRKIFLPYCDEDEKYYRDQSRVYTLDDTYELRFIPTASTVYPKEAFEQVLSYFTTRVPTEDLRRRLYLTSLGYSYYLNDITCVYRQNVPNSAMTKWKSQSSDLVYDRSNRIVEMISDLDRMTNGVHEKGLWEIKKNHVAGMLYHAGSFAVLKNDDCKKLFKSLPLLKKIKVLLSLAVPNRLKDFLKTLKHKRKT